MRTLNDEIMIKGLRIRNRITLPPLTTNYGSPEGGITNAVVQFYSERAKDVGLVTAELKAGVGLPVIAVGKLGDEKVAAKAVRGTGIDMVAIGRQMIIDPDTARKILDGRGDEIVRCEECMTCFASLGLGKPMACKVNKDLPGSYE